MICPNTHHLVLGLQPNVQQNLWPVTSLVERQLNLQMKRNCPIVRTPCLNFMCQSTIRCCHRWKKRLRKPQNDDSNLFFQSADESRWLGWQMVHKCHNLENDGKITNKQKWTVPHVLWLNAYMVLDHSYCTRPEDALFFPLFVHSWVWLLQPCDRRTLSNQPWHILICPQERTVMLRTCSHTSTPTHTHTHTQPISAAHPYRK